jgi:hypothetical protein
MKSSTRPRLPNSLIWILTCLLLALVWVGILATKLEHQLKPEIDRKGLKSTTYVDIKSECLRDILRTVLEDIKWLCLGEDKPTVSPDRHAMLSRLINAPD